MIAKSYFFCSVEDIAIFWFHVVKLRVWRQKFVMFLVMVIQVSEQSRKCCCCNPELIVQSIDHVAYTVTEILHCLQLNILQRMYFNDVESIDLLV